MVLCLVEFASAAWCSVAVLMMAHDKMKTVRHARDAKACVDNRSQLRGRVAFAVANV